MWIDAHSHLADPKIQQFLKGYLVAAKDKGIGAWIQGGINPDDWARQKDLKQKLGSGIALCFGLHPWWVATASNAEIDQGLECLKREISQAVALGELGLDFMPKRLEGDSKAKQLRAFRAQLTLGDSAGKPLVLHIVQAHEEALQILENRPKFLKGGIVHSFTGNIEEAKRYLSLGFVISVGGAVTRPGYKSVKGAIPLIPASGLVIETDAPDQKPEGIDGDFNEPENLILIAQAVAKHRKEDYSVLLDRSSETLSKIFGLVL